MSAARHGPIAYDMLTSLNLSVKLIQSLRRAGVLRKDFRFHHYRGKRSGNRHPWRAVSPHSSGRHLKNRAVSNVWFGLLNIRSLNNKVVRMMDLLHQEDIDVFSMTETWHDIGSFALDRLRAAAFTVIDCPRPRDPNDAPSALLCVNHGGVAVLVQTVRNLGIWLDSDCSRTTHINKTTRSCYASLREIPSIAAPLSLDVLKLLIMSFILS